MAPTMHTVLGARAAEVDDVRLEPGGAPQKLTEDQIKRLGEIGVELESIEVEDADVPADVKPLSALKKAEAIARAEAAGLDTEGTLPELLERLEAHAQAQADDEGGDR